MLQAAGSASFLEPRWWNVGYAKLTTDEELAYLASGLLVCFTCVALVERGLLRAGERLACLASARRRHRERRWRLTAAAREQARMPHAARAAQPQRR